MPRASLRAAGAELKGGGHKQVDSLNDGAGLCNREGLANPFINLG